MKWHYVDEEGNPKKSGVYWVTLIYPEQKKVDEEGNEWKATGKTLVDVDTRYLGEATKDNLEWKMQGQPDNGLIWTQETGSYEGETVWAWAEMEETPLPERLPEGAEAYHGKD